MYEPAVSTRLGILKRLGIGTIASAYGYFVTATLQVLSLPFLLHAWGTELYGKWLMLTILPAYLVLSDLGFSTAVTVDVARKFGDKQLRAAQVAFRSVWVLSSSISVGLSAAALASLLFIPDLIARTGFLDASQAYAIPLIVCYSAGILQTTIIAAGLRSTGRYAEGTFFPDNITLLEGLAVIAVATAGAGPAGAAATLLSVRLVGLVLLTLFMRRRVPWLGVSYEGASLAEVRRLFGPSISLSLMPVGLAVSLQGTIAVVGIALSPALAATFASARTICRLAVQVAATVNRASVPELSLAIGGKRPDVIAVILLANVVTVALFILPVNLLLAIFGSKIIQIWSLGKIEPTHGLMTAISLGVLFHACWWNAANLLTATGRQRQFSPHFLLLSLAAVALSWPACHAFGLIGPALVVLLLEILMFLRVAFVLSRSGLFDRAVLSGTIAAITNRLRPLLWLRAKGNEKGTTEANASPTRATGREGAPRTAKAEASTRFDVDPRLTPDRML